MCHSSRSSQEMFERLLKKTGEAYASRESIGKYLSYSVIAMPLQLERPLLLGINWGGSPVEAFKPQEIGYFQSKEFIDEPVTTYRFIQRTKSFAKTYLGLDMDEGFNYSNLCFFRTQYAHQLTEKDFTVCRPILQEMINYLNPPYILSLGTSVLPYLPDPSTKLITHTLGKARSIFTKSFGKPHIILPHPNYPVTGPARQDAWERAGKYLNSV